MSLKIKFFGFLITLIAILSSFTIGEDEVVVVLRLGRLRGEPIVEAGHHWKIPFVDEVKRFDKRVQTWESLAGEIPTRDKKFVIVETTARWRIENAVAFYRSVRDLRTATLRMSPILEGAAKDIISSHPLSEAIRNTNAVLENKKVESDEEDSELEYSAQDVQAVEFGREKLSQQIEERARDELTGLGIALVDVQLRSISYQESVEAKVFESMIAERQQISTRIRSAGRAEQARILGQLERARESIESTAYEQSQRVRAKAESEAASLYEKELEGDAEFFKFIRTLELYRQNLSGLSGDLILSTKSDILELFGQGPSAKDLKGR